MNTQSIGPKRTFNPVIPRDGAWFHQQAAGLAQLYSYAHGDWRAFVHVDCRGRVFWAVCRAMEQVEWVEATDADAAMVAARKKLGEVV